MLNHNLSSRNIRGLSQATPLNDHCLPKQMETNVAIHLDLEHLSESVPAEDVKAVLKEDDTLYLLGTGQWLQCYDTLKVNK